MAGLRYWGKSVLLSKAGDSKHAAVFCGFAPPGADVRKTIRIPTCSKEGKKMSWFRLSRQI